MVTLEVMPDVVVFVDAKSFFKAKNKKIIRILLLLKNIYLN